MIDAIFNRDREVSEAVRERAVRLDANESLDRLMDRIGDARYVLLGEASHGTSEYYTWRARISQRLIQEKGFRFIAVEGDWPDCYEVNRYVKGWPDSGDNARTVLRKYDRWPTWMWANWEVAALAEWMRQHNQAQPDEKKVGFYGLDVYSLWESLEAVLGHLREYHPEALEQAHEAMACFEPFNRDAQTYAWSTRLTPDDCADEVLNVLHELRNRPSRYPDDPEEHFNAEQNALVAVGAERYYRAMVGSDNESWNVRDIHMADTLDRLMTHHGPDAKAIVWEHNTHIGDARATDMADAGMVNIGQLARERHAQEGVVLVGFGSYEGSVIAGRRWGAPMERMTVPPAREGSWEQILHETDPGDKMLLLDDFRNVRGMDAVRGHRAIGVVYNPEQERYGNYVPTVLPLRYDAFLYLERTQALHPMHLMPHTSHEPPETYPWGM
jgi:erythromycin esterase-like protein